MRTVARFHQVARLERRAQPYLEQKRQDGKEYKRTVEGAAAHAAVLVFLLRYGNPQIDEPLSHACERCERSDAWNDFKQQYWFPREYPRRRFPFAPFGEDFVTTRGTALRHWVIRSCSGLNEKIKLQTEFDSAPPWLLWFTFADYTAKLLGLTLPDLSEVSRFKRTKANFDLWWGLPKEAFEREYWSELDVGNPLKLTDLKFLHRTVEHSPGQMTRRQLRREGANRMAAQNVASEESWPWLIPEDLLRSIFNKDSGIDFHELSDDFHHASIGRPKRPLK